MLLFGGSMIDRRERIAQQADGFFIDAECCGIVQGMRMYCNFPSLLLGLALVGGLAASAQPLTPPAQTTAGQDVKNAGKDTSKAAKNVAKGTKKETRKAYHATKKDTKKAYKVTKKGTKKAYHKTKSTTVGAVKGAKEGAKQ